MTPEEKARVKIDQWFADAGWKVVNRDEYEPTISAVAIREGLLKGNLEADYFLFINGKAVGVLEAKREEINISSNIVSEQAITYAKSVPDCYQAWQKPLPFLFKSNGKEIEFFDYRHRETSEWETISRILTPKEIVKMLGIDDPFAGLPTLNKKGLRECQYEAVTELEKSFRIGQNRALMVLATGAGKTYTACLTAYRMLSYTPMRRVLFLVDRNNLGKQAETEFGTFRLTETGDAFNTIYAVNRLKSAEVPTDSNVVICTIQRLFSLLKGEEITDTDDDDEDTADGEVTLPDNPNLPHDFFDLIIIDECHRSIYGNWRKVLEYFDTARLIGLTATPIPETMAFFNNNRVVNYTLEATGTDVKPLEVVMFMRDVASAPLYTQMKGRGVRTIGDEQLRNVTPNAISKDCFFLVDAVGVTEHEHIIPGQYEGPETETITLKELLERIAHGNLPDNYLKRLAATLSRLYNKADNAQRQEFVRIAHDDMLEIAQRIYNALDPEHQPQLPPYVDINEPNNERKGLVSPIANHANVRKYILILAAGFVNTLMPGEDTLISKGFSIEEAQSTTDAFEQYCCDHCDDIEALRILYNNEGEPITYSMLKDLENKLKMENNRFAQKLLWNSYAIVYGDKVRRTTRKEESEALTNIIQLVRFAYHQTEKLESAYPTARSMFNLWYGRKQMDITAKQKDLIGKIVEYIAANGACNVREIRKNDVTHAAQLIAAFGNMKKADEALDSVYKFIVLRTTA